MANDPRPWIAQRDAFIERFRKTGKRDEEELAALETTLRQALKQTDNAREPELLLELGTVQRLAGRFEEAAATLPRAETAAEREALPDVAFKAAIGEARCHAYGTRNHGAAARALRRARSWAGEDPSPKQRYELADYEGQLQSGRGEIEAALANGLLALSLAATDSDRFYAQLNAGDALQKLAESCDYRPLVDAKTAADGDDRWGACRRAVAAARRYYAEAEGTARGLKWSFLEAQAADMIKRLDMRLQLIDGRASMESNIKGELFQPESANEVLVNENFEGGASMLGDLERLAPLIEEVVDRDEGTARDSYLLGLHADLQGNPTRALALYQRAVVRLEQERATWRDARQSGTVVENRPEFMRDLGMRLLSRGRQSEAFLVFESLRARGLSTLRSAHRRHRFSEPERRFLADLLQAQSTEAQALRRLVEITIAGEPMAASLQAVEALGRATRAHRELLALPVASGILDRLSDGGEGFPTLQDLQSAAGSQDIAVLAYWVTTTNVLAWVVTPERLQVRTVFLPAHVLAAKSRSLVDGMRRESDRFDTALAKHLYTYLVAPFSEQIGDRDLIIIPHGPLMEVPFEALINARTGRYLIQERAVSYAPNGAFATWMLRAKPKPLGMVHALFDSQIETRTGEIASIRAAGVQVTLTPGEQQSKSQVLALLSRGSFLHVLLHGRFATDEGLQSTLQLPRQGGRSESITAAELAGANWHDKALVVLSACEGAMLRSRISNEVEGVAWAPLAGGAERLLLNRWRVSAAHNARWMEAFYGALARGTPVVDAVAKTMRAFLTRNATKHPYYWAGPQLTGR